MSEAAYNNTFDCIATGNLLLIVFEKFVQPQLNDCPILMSNHPRVSRPSGAGADLGANSTCCCEKIGGVHQNGSPRSLHFAKANNRT